MPAPNEITKEKLARLIATPDAPLVVDVCIPEDIEQDPRFIPGSIRHSHKELDALLNRVESRRVVVVCWKGLKLSQGVAAWLRSEGIAAEYLKDGHMGWSAAGLPLVPNAAVPFRADGTTLWVTRHRPKIDRIACPWLIRRFVDAKARFLFVSPGEVTNVADRFGATPFDVEDVHFTHRGDMCSFDTMLDEFGLRTEALDRVASVIRAADTNRHDLHPAAAGLLAISVGLSRQYRDDNEMLKAGMAIYDALYRWARDAHDEGHDWPTNQGRTKLQ